MSASPSPAPSAHAADVEGVLLGVVAVYLLAVGVFQLVAPGTFYDALAPFPPQSDHFIRDGGSFHLALGVGAALAVRRSSWRPPLIAVLALQFVVHALNHLADIDETDPAWLGAFDFAVVALGAAALCWALARGRTRR